MDAKSLSFLTANTRTCLSLMMSLLINFINICRSVLHKNKVELLYQKCYVVAIIAGAEPF